MVLPAREQKRTVENAFVGRFSSDNIYLCIYVQGIKWITHLVQVRDTLRLVLIK